MEEHFDVNKSPVFRFIYCLLIFIIKITLIFSIPDSTYKPVLHFFLGGGFNKVSTVIFCNKAIFFWSKDYISQFSKCIAMTLVIGLYTTRGGNGGS